MPRPGGGATSRSPRPTWRASDGHPPQGRPAMERALAGLDRPWVRVAAAAGRPSPAEAYRRCSRQVRRPTGADPNDRMPATGLPARLPPQCSRKVTARRDQRSDFKAVSASDWFGFSRVCLCRSMRPRAAVKYPGLRGLRGRRGRRASSRAARTARGCMRRRIHDRLSRSAWRSTFAMNCPGIRDAGTALRGTRGEAQRRSSSEEDRRWPTLSGWDLRSPQADGAVVPVGHHLHACWVLEPGDRQAEGAAGPEGPGLADDPEAPALGAVAVDGGPGEPDG
jgi:hypothetical protein